MTKQEFKDECDINRILSQYKLTGIISHINKNQPLYTDLPDASDYQESLNTLNTAETAFASLPSVVRSHFNNDPGEFLAAFSDPKAEPFLREHGLLKPLPSPAPEPGLSRPEPQAPADPSLSNVK